MNPWPCITCSLVDWRDSLFWCVQKELHKSNEQKQRDSQCLIFPPKVLCKVNKGKKSSALSARDESTLHFRPVLIITTHVNICSYSEKTGSKYAWVLAYQELSMLAGKINFSYTQTQTNYLKTIAPTPLGLINNTHDASATSGGWELLHTGRKRSPTCIIQLQDNSETFNSIFPLKGFVSWTFFFFTENLQK